MQVSCKTPLLFERLGCTRTIDLGIDRILMSHDCDYCRECDRIVDYNTVINSMSKVIEESQHHAGHETIHSPVRSTDAVDGVWRSLDLWCALQTGELDVVLAKNTNGDRASPRRHRFRCVDAEVVVGVYKLCH